MKDIPLFTTEFGVASLGLKEVLTRGEGYIHIRDVLPGQLSQLLDECVRFCRMVGAERIYATGHEGLEAYPFFTAVYEMQGEVLSRQEELDHLFPVTEQTVSRWRQICNERLSNVDCAATLSSWDEKKILSSGGAYFVHRQGELLGTGWIENGVLLLICGVKPREGERVVRTLLSVADGQRVRLEVASTNTRAIGLYERLGFIKTGEISRWYCVWDPERNA